MGNTGLTASTTWTTWSRPKQTAGMSKPTIAAKSNTAASTAACVPPSKPYNGYKMDQKLV